MKTLFGRRKRERQLLETPIKRSGLATTWFGAIVTTLLMLSIGAEAQRSGRDHRHRDRPSDRFEETVVLDMRNEIFSDQIIRRRRQPPPRSRHRSGRGERGGFSGFIEEAVMGELQRRINPGVNHHGFNAKDFRSVLPLKKEIRQQEPRILLRDYELVEVEVIAKSEIGAGQVTLYVGDRFQASERVFGSRRDFRSRDRRTYDRVTLFNRDQNTVGRQKWQLEFTDDLVKVDQIIVHLKRKFRRPLPPPTRLITESLGTEKADKIATPKFFRVNARDVREVAIRGVRKEVHVHSVEVHYRNGRTAFLSELRGFIRDGETVSAVVSPGNIQRIVVEASSTNLFNSRAKYEVLIRHQAGRRR